jgi:hypothetical protein
VRVSPAGCSCGCGRPSLFHFSPHRTWALPSCLTQSLTRETPLFFRRGITRVTPDAVRTRRRSHNEAARLWASMAIVPENKQRDYLERCFRAAGFEIAARERVDSERREERIEKGESDLQSTLLRLARMRRREEELVTRYGRPLYEATYGSELWSVYQLLGKLCPMEYLLRKL